LLGGKKDIDLLGSNNKNTGFEFGSGRKLTDKDLGISKKKYKLF